MTSGSLELGVIVPVFISLFFAVRTLLNGRPRKWLGLGRAVPKNNRFLVRLYGLLSEKPWDFVGEAPRFFGHGEMP
jgi:hypothetical protein